MQDQKLILLCIILHVRQIPPNKTCKIISCGLTFTETDSSFLLLPRAGERNMSACQWPVAVLTNTPKMAPKCLMVR